MVHLDEKTKVSLFAVLASLPFLVAAIIWIAGINTKAEAAQSEIDSLRPIVMMMKDTLIRIDENVNFLKNNYKRGD